MKKLVTLALILFTTSSYGVMMDQLPQKEAERIHSKNYDYPEQGYRSDTINTGQSSARRMKPKIKCVDKSGYAYFKNDSGYAACINQRSLQMKSHE